MNSRYPIEGCRRHYLLYQLTLPPCPEWKELYRLMHPYMTSDPRYPWMGQTNTEFCQGLTHVTFAQWDDLPNKPDFNHPILPYLLLEICGPLVWRATNYSGTTLTLSLGLRPVHPPSICSSRRPDGIPFHATLAWLDMKRRFDPDCITNRMHFALRQMTELMDAYTGWIVRADHPRTSTMPNCPPPINPDCPPGLLSL